MKIRAISLWEPWASLIRTGAKTYETRSRSINYRGPILICAAKGGLNKGKLFELILKSPFQKGLAPLIGRPLDFTAWPPYQGIELNHLNFGKAVALVKITDCYNIGVYDLILPEQEKHFGDFTPGRYAWKLRMINNTFEPFPVKGRQGFFDVELPEGVKL